MNFKIKAIREDNYLTPSSLQAVKGGADAILCTNNSCNFNSGTCNVNLCNGNSGSCTTNSCGGNYPPAPKCPPLSMTSNI